MADMVLHVQRRDNDHTDRRMLRSEPQSRKSRGRPKGRLVDVEEDNVKLVGVRIEEEEDRTKWRQMTGCGETLKEKKTEGETGSSSH